MNKIKVLVTGLGGIGQIAHLPLLTKMEEVEIAAVCDSDKSKAKNIAAKYTVKKFYTDNEAMLNDVKADCLIVASPTNFHRDTAIKAFEKSLHVLVEKPLARNYAEALEIVEAS